MTLFTKIVAPIALALTASAASAATVTDTIYLGSAIPDLFTHSSYTYTAGGGDLTMEATGHELNADGAIGDQVRINKTLGGLGVTTCGRFTCLTDSPTVDSFGSDEVIKFAFDSAVSIKRIYFSEIDASDDFSFSVIGAGCSVMDFDPRINMSLLGGFGLLDGRSYEFAEPLAVSNIFGIGAHGFGDSFRIAALEIVWEEDTPAVPLPASALLMVGAFGTFGAMRRRRKAA